MFKLRPHQVELYVSDMDRTVRWWKDIFGFEKKYEGKTVLPDYGEVRMFRIESDEVVVECLELKGFENSKKHVLFTMENFKDYDVFVRHIEKQGVNVVHRAIHIEPEEEKEVKRESKAVYIDDPDENIIEVRQSKWKGLTNGILYTVFPVTMEQLKKLEERTAARLGTEVRLKNRIDKSILGGAKIYVDGKLIDASLKTQLENMKQRMKTWG